MSKVLCYYFIASLLITCTSNLYGQETINDTTSKLKRVTILGGMGLGYPLNSEDKGIAYGIEYEIQKNKAIISLGVHRIQEFLIFGSTPTLSATSGDVMYGKAFSTGKYYSSVNIGIGYVSYVLRGAYIYSDPGLLSNDHYEKIKKGVIGIPISFKVFLVPRYRFGAGLELYANINKNPFYIISYGFQFGRLRRRTKKI